MECIFRSYKNCIYTWKRKEKGWELDNGSTELVPDVMYNSKDGYT
jgi:hypothetical protein